MNEPIIIDVATPLKRDRLGDEDVGVPATSAASRRVHRAGTGARAK